MPARKADSWAPAGDSDPGKSGPGPWTRNPSFLTSVSDDTDAGGLERTLWVTPTRGAQVTKQSGGQNDTREALWRKRVAAAVGQQQQGPGDSGRLTPVAPRAQPAQRVLGVGSQSPLTQLPRCLT